MALAAQLLLHLAGPRREAWAADPSLETRLTALVQDARAAWPGVTVSDGELLAYLAARLPPEGDAAAALGALRTSDLYLACACARGDAAALRAMEAGPLAEVAAAVKRSTLHVPVDEVMQAVRRLLFVASADAAPRIADYRGTGELRAWLRVTAVRAALKLLRKDRHQVALDDEALAALPAAGGDVELEFVKRQYRAGFKRAFLDAMASLPAREQNLLRQHFLDDLSIDQLGALYHVHRSTTARWIARAQSTLFERTKRTLMKQMKVSRSECESIIRLAQSQLHVTLRTLTIPPG